MIKLHTLEEVRNALAPPRLEQIEMRVPDEYGAEYFHPSHKPDHEATAEARARKDAALIGGVVLRITHTWEFNDSLQIHRKLTSCLMLRQPRGSLIGKDEDGDYIAIPLND